MLTIKKNKDFLLSTKFCANHLNFTQIISKKKAREILLNNIGISSQILSLALYSIQQRASERVKKRALSWELIYTPICCWFV